MHTRSRQTLTGRTSHTIVHTGITNVNTLPPSVVGVATVLNSPSSVPRPPSLPGVGLHGTHVLGSCPGLQNGGGLTNVVATPVKYGVAHVGIAIPDITMSTTATVATTAMIATIVMVTNTLPAISVLPPPFSRCTQWEKGWG